MPVIGFLNGTTAVGWVPFVGAFHQALMENGYLEGRKVVFESRFADGVIAS
jgi:hypothetical protein